MAKQTINLGNPNQKDGDLVRDAFNKVNQNFTELYNSLANNSSVVVDDTAPTSPSAGDLWWDQVGGRLYVYYSDTWVDASPVDGAGISSTNELVNGAHTVSLGSDGNLTVPDRITFSDDTWQSTAFIGHAYSLRNNPTGSLYVTLDDNGTINTPLLLPLTFTAVLDPTHYVGEGSLTLEGDAWGYTVQFQVNPNGTVQTMIDNLAQPSNPGYIDGLEFEYTEEDHGILGYTFTLTITDVQNPGPMMYTANLAASQPPEYPSTVKSLGAIKLTANDQNLVFGTDGTLTLPDALYVTTGLDGAIIGTNGVVVKAKNANPLSLEWSLNDEENIYAENPALNTVTASLAFGLNGVNIEVNNPDNGGSWTFGPDGKLSVPGPIFRDGGLYMNSSGSTTAASVFVNGFGGSVILRTANNADQVSYDLTFDVNGETSFPGRLNFSDGSTLGDNTLTGAVDSDLGLEVKRTISVSHACYIGTVGEFIADIEFNDDITVADVGWTVVIGDTTYTVESVVEGAPANQFRLIVPGATFVSTETYTFRNPVPESNIWVIRSQTGGILGPGGAIITNETAPLGGGGTYRDFSIELPTPDGLNEKRWTFSNDGNLTLPDGESKIYSADPNISGGINGIGVVGKDRIYLTITNSNGSFMWDFRDYGLADYSTNRKPAIMFPGGSWIEEDLTNQSLNYGMMGPLTIGSQDKLIIRTSTLDEAQSPTATYDWQFGKDGGLTFPDTSVQTTAYPGTLAAAKLPYYADTTARDTAIPSPVNGMVVIVGGSLYFYGNSLWLQIAGTP